MSIVQSFKAPDNLTIEAERGEDGEKTGFQVARVGTVALRILTFADNCVVISQDDLRKLGKEHHRLGWTAHRMHTQSSLERSLKDLEP